MNKDILNLINFGFVISFSLKKSFINLEGKFRKIAFEYITWLFDPKILLYYQNFK